jgi:hypothetical protein
MNWMEMAGYSDGNKDIDVSTLVHFAILWRWTRLALGHIWGCISSANSVLSPDGWCSEWVEPEARKLDGSRD